MIAVAIDKRVELSDNSAVRKALGMGSRYVESFGLEERRVHLIEIGVLDKRERVFSAPDSSTPLLALALGRVDPSS